MSDARGAEHQIRVDGLRSPQLETGFVETASQLTNLGGACRLSTVDILRRRKDRSSGARNWLGRLSTASSHNQTSQY
jgi:hypothetical protein